MNLGGVPAVSVTTVATYLGGMSGPGGPIPVGTYYLTSETVYSGGTSDPATKKVWVFESCTGSGIARETDDSPSFSAWSYALVDDSTYGWVITLTPLCGGSATKMVYSSLGTPGFTTYDFSNNRVETFAKQ